MENKERLAWQAFCLDCVMVLGPGEGKRLLLGFCEFVQHSQNFSSVTEGQLTHDPHESSEKWVRDQPEKAAALLTLLMSYLLEKHGPGTVVFTPEKPDDQGNV